MAYGCVLYVEFLQFRCVSFCSETGQQQQQW